MIRTRTSLHRGGAALAALAVAAVGLVATATPAAADADITSTGPLERVGISSDLDCAVDYVADSHGQWYGDTACATVVAVGDEIFGPADIPAGSSLTGAVGYSAYTPVSQSGPAGTGSAADPYVITTVVDLGTTGLRLTQRDYYVTGQETTRTDATLTNSGSAKQAVVYRAADCYLQDSDNGMGEVVGSAITCTADPGAPNPDRIQQFIPITGGSHHMQADYDEIWAAVGTGTQLPDTCRCEEVIDNGMALSWGVTVPASGSTTVSAITAFSPTGAQPVRVSSTVTPGTVEAGGLVTYTVVIDNPGATEVTLDTVSNTLPEGFTYQDGTSTGATTSDPSVTDQTITWSGPIAVPSSGSASISFTVQASDVLGTYTSSATATGVGATVIGAVDVAPVEVVAAEEPVDPSSTTTPGTVTTTPEQPGSVPAAPVAPAPPAPPAAPVSGQASYTG